MRFTDPQRQAIGHDGNLLIVAGPGSGKTSTTVAKAQRILEDDRRSLVMVTFSKEGAEEMRRRLAKSHQESGQPAVSGHRLLIGTFHSLAIKHLFDHKPREKVLSPGQQELLLQDALRPFSGDMKLTKELRKDFESFQFAIDRDSYELKKQTAVVVARYAERLRASRATDLFTIMRDCALAAQQGTIPLLRCTDMVVDEGQDTDELQKAWIFAHCRAGVRVTIVGDDDQSIYEWRQALGFSVMQSFLDTFKARRVELGDNFRSRKEILDRASVLINHNTKRLGKDLVAMRGTGGFIGAYHTASASGQCDELAELISQTPDIHTNVAVLARKNRSLDELEMSLTAKDVAYVRVGQSIWKNSAVVGYLGLLQALIDASPAGIFGCLDTLDLNDQFKSLLMVALSGHAHEFLENRFPELPEGDGEDRKRVADFTKASAYWRSQLRSAEGSSVDEVVLDVGSWLSSKHRSRRNQDLIIRAADIMCRLSGTLANRLNFIAHSRSKAAGTSAVTLMTMHGSKGMEFETVHVIDANHPDDGSTLVNEEAERRLLYVAITRAKDRCVLWYNEAPHTALKESGVLIFHEFKALAKALSDKA